MGIGSAGLLNAYCVCYLVMVKYIFSHRTNPVLPTTQHIDLTPTASLLITANFGQGVRFGNRTSCVDLLRNMFTRLEYAHALRNSLCDCMSRHHIKSTMPNITLTMHTYTIPKCSFQFAARMPIIVCWFRFVIWWFQSAILHIRCKILTLNVIQIIWICFCMGHNFVSDLVLAQTSMSNLRVTHSWVLPNMM